MVEPTSRPQKFGGSMIAPSMPEDDSLMIDPNLLVGPLYVPGTSRTDRIKEQLGDITSKLHKTLYDFDEFAEFEPGHDPLLEMKNKIGAIDDLEMRTNLNQFMDQYEDMSMQVTTANKDRDEMLLQLADWFTTDHVDLEDIKVSLDESEEERIKNSYFDTVTNFEKLKKLQQQITNASKAGKSTRKLEKVKVDLEKDVVDKFKVMKDMSMQTMKLKVSDDAPWKYAANEIVAMLSNVRGENAEEMAAITKKMQGMIDQLEKQAQTIKSLTAELREKKEVVKKLTDENSDLSSDLAVFRARYNRYEKDLEAAKQMIRTLHSEKQTESVDADTGSVKGKPISESISKVLAQIETQPGPEAMLKMDADPALQTKLLEYQEALECIRSEYSRAAEDIEELTTELEEKKEYINSIENENEKLMRDIKKLRQERRQSIAAGVIAPAPGEGHQCEHCKCHVPEKEIDEEIEELRREVKKWQDKCNYFKKCLADTELKLSDAYKEISELRMDRDPVPQMAPAPAPASDRPPATADGVHEKPTVEKKAKDKPSTATPKEPKPKPKPRVQARYMDSTKKQTETKKLLPPIEKTPIEEKIEEHIPGLTQKHQRELKLYHAGDLQAQLNLLVTEIMEFVTEIGKLLYTEKDEGNKIQSMKAFTFDQSTAKKQKELKDPKEEEARQKKSNVIFSGQHAVSILRDAFDTLSNSLNLQHDEYEAIYRSFKVSQKRNSVRREVMMGRLPASALHDFDRQQQQNMGSGPENLLNVYFKISYGGGVGAGIGSVTNKHRQGTGLQRQSSSVYSIISETEESEAKLKNTMHVLSMQRSKSDLDNRDTPQMIGGNMMGTGLLRERSQIYLTNVPDAAHRESISQGNKQEMKIGVAMVPRKGLISLSTNDHAEIHPMAVQGERRRSSVLQQESHSAKSKSLIKRKDILEQIKMGTKLLEDAEAEKRKEEEMTKSLGDYTILDLQSKLLEMTDTRSARRGFSGHSLEIQPNQVNQKKTTVAKAEKSVTLPAIKNFNPFT